MTKAEYLLICLMEECAEVQQAAAKALRFGMQSTSPEGTTNEHDLMLEYEHLKTVMSCLLKEGFAKPPSLPEILEIGNQKEQKLAYYMELSRERGFLEQDTDKAR